MREKQVKCFSSAADAMKGPAGFMTSSAFRNLRWTMAGDQRDERMRLFCRKLLKRLDGLGMPFYPEVGLMEHKTAQGRYVRGVDPWPPMANPYLDGVAVKFRHCIHEELEPRCWALFAEIGFDVARLAQIPIAWGGFSVYREPGYWEVYDGPSAEIVVDRRTYGVRKGIELPYQL